MSRYTKPYLTVEQQLELLRSRGLEITDKRAALEYLHRLGYYRLSGYWYIFREPSPILQNKYQTPKDTFLPKSKFQDAVLLYVFDKKLRLLVLDAIERLEVAFRVEIANFLGAKDAYTHYTSRCEPRRM